MNKPTFSSFDHKILEQLNTKIDCSISIELGLNGLAYAIFHNHQLVAIEWYNTPLSSLEAVFQKNDWLLKEFASSHICSTTSKFTLIPHMLFTDDKKANYLDFNHRKVDQLDVLTDKIDHIDSVCVYGVSKAEQDIVSTFFSKSTFTHFSTKYIPLLLTENKNLQAKKMLVHITYNQLYITVTENSSLLFFNLFGYSNEHDCTYYILFACEQLNLNPETIQLEFSGDISKDSKIYELVYTYIRHVSFRKNQQSISPVITGLENYSHIPLIHQHL